MFQVRKCKLFPNIEGREVLFADMEKEELEI